MALLELRRISTFSGHRALCSDVSFCVERGALIALTGPSGAGDGVVLDAISGRRPPDRGEVLLHGARLGALSPERRCRLGMVRVFPRGPAGWAAAEGRRTALEQAAAGALSRTGDGRVARELAAAQLEAVGLHARAHAAVAALTPAEQRRLALARALAARPDLLLLEEPLRGLDAEAGAALLELLQALRRAGLGVLVAGAELGPVAGGCDRVVVLAAGEKIFEGTPRQLAGDRGVQAAILGEGA